MKFEVKSITSDSFFYIDSEDEEAKDKVNKR